MKLLLKKEDLLKWNRLGFIPGPKENEIVFLKRISHVLGYSRKKNKETQVSKYLWKKSLYRARDKYDIFPIWTKIIYKNQGLNLWEGACTWVLENEEGEIASCFLQMKKAFLNKHLFLGIYLHEDVLLHEFSHVARMAYPDDKFEEIHAYKSDSSYFRRFLGGALNIFYLTLTALFFLLSNILNIFLFGFLDIWKGYFFLSINVTCLIFTCFFILQFIYLKYLYLKTRSLLSDLVGLKTACHILYRLEESEIKQFSSFSHDKILEFVKIQRKRNLRWKVIAYAYFDSVFKLMQ